MTKHFLFSLTLLVAVLSTAKAQTVAVKTNLLYGIGTLTPNAGIEIGLGRKTTFDLSAGYNPWNLNGSQENNQKKVHYLIEPEFRYWFCERFNGHFVGAHALFSQYNVGGYDVPSLFEKEYRYQGYALGGGVSYGYHLMLSKRWGVEFNIGLGVDFMKYDQYTCAKCGEKVGTKDKTYFGPTKAGVTLIYLIK